MKDIFSIEAMSLAQQVEIDLLYSGRMELDDVSCATYDRLYDYFCGDMPPGTQKEDFDDWIKERLPEILINWNRNT